VAPSLAEGPLIIPKLGAFPGDPGITTPEPDIIDPIGIPPETLGQPTCSPLTIAEQDACEVQASDCINDAFDQELICISDATTAFLDCIASEPTGELVLDFEFCDMLKVADEMSCSQTYELEEDICEWERHFCLNPDPCNYT
jgi:hypothetical protein